MIALATWNIRNLSKKKPLESLVAIATIISQFDIIAIQEVRDEIVIKSIIAYLNSMKNAPYSYAISPPVGSALTKAHQTGKHKEHYAFIWNSRVTLQSPTALLEADHVFVRPPFVGFFRADNFDFVLATIHVIWGKTTDRKDEANNIHSILEKTFSRCAAMGENDIILCGDFNMPPQRISVTDWTPLVTQDYTMVGDTNLYDQIWINKKYTSEYTGRVEIVKFDLKYGSREEAVKKISDHRPVCAWFATDKDDDNGDVVNINGIKID